MKIVLTDTAHLSAEAIKTIEALPATVYKGVPTSAAEVIERIGDAEIAMSSYVAMDADVLAACKNLRYLIIPASGYQGVDLAYADAHGITVMNCPIHNSQAVAEQAIALLFAVARKVVSAAEAVKHGEWQAANFEGIELAGKTMGVVGNGNVGRRIARMAEGIGMRVRAVDIGATDDEVTSLLRTSDVVSLSVPLTEKTHHFINESRIALMRPHAIIVNVSRGPVVDRVALVQALSAGKLGGAALDVVEDEPIVGTPPPASNDSHFNGAIRKEIVALAKMPNVVLTPHMGWNTTGTVQRQGEEVLEAIHAIMEGNPVHVVNNP